jgi:hypothetical protein
MDSGNPIKFAFHGCLAVSRLAQGGQPLGKLTGGKMPPAALPGAIKTCELPGKKWVIAPLTDQSFCPHRAIGRKPHLLGVGTFLNGFPQGDEYSVEKT